MIKIFETGKDYDRKFNAVDDKNHFVGYSLHDDCCAGGGWTITPSILREEPKDIDDKVLYDLLAYDFDLDFFEVIDGRSKDVYYNAVVFRMTAKDKPDLYLHLYNCHNGYYSKGFERSWGEIREGQI